MIENDITAHSNYSKTTCKKHINTNYYAFDKSDTFIIDANDYEHNMMKSFFSRTIKE